MHLRAPIPNLRIIIVGLCLFAHTYFWLSLVKGVVSETVKSGDYRSLRLRNDTRQMR